MREMSSSNWWWHSDCFTKKGCGCSDTCTCRIQCECVVCKPCPPKPCPPKPCPPPNPCPPASTAITLSTGPLFIPENIAPQSVVAHADVLNLNASFAQFVTFRVYDWGSGASATTVLPIFETGALIGPNSRQEFTYAGLPSRHYELRFIIQSPGRNLIINTWASEGGVGPTPVTFFNIEGLTVLNKDLTPLV